jgi:hypothetical protein
MVEEQESFCANVSKASRLGRAHAAGRIALLRGVERLEAEPGVGAARRVAVSAARTRLAYDRRWNEKTALSWARPSLPACWRAASSVASRISFPRC